MFHPVPGKSASNKSGIKVRPTLDSEEILKKNEEIVTETEAKSSTVPQDQNFVKNENEVKIENQATNKNEKNEEKTFEAVKDSEQTIENVRPRASTLSITLQVNEDDGKNAKFSRGSTKSSLTITEDQHSSTLNSPGSQSSSRNRQGSSQYLTVPGQKTDRENANDSEWRPSHASDSWSFRALPFTPLWCGILCLILNIFLPGIGTICVGLFGACCGEARNEQGKTSGKEKRNVKSKGNKNGDNGNIEAVLGMIFANFAVGIAQLFTVTFLLVGWLWSVAWGIHILALSCMILALHIFNYSDDPITISKGSQNQKS